jgi:hypothetical protein
MLKWCAMISALRKLHQKYRDRPMSLADPAEK